MSDRCRHCHLWPDECRCDPVAIADAAARVVDGLRVRKARRLLLEALAFAAAHRDTLLLDQLYLGPDGRAVPLRELIRMAKPERWDVR